jgi:hypothetical protein
MPSKFLFALILLATAWSPSGFSAEPPPKWSTIEGASLRAAFGGLAADRIILVVDGKPLPVPVNRLSPASLEQAKTLAPTVSPKNPPVAPSPPKRSYFFDEASSRHLIVTDGEAGEVEVRAYWTSGGYFAHYEGNGARRGKPEDKESEFTFSQVIGGEGERGTAFTATQRGSKLEIRYAEGQREPQDAGINGLYEQVSAEKAIALAKKEWKASSSALEEQFRDAPRNWPGPDRKIGGEWANRWPALRANWVKLIFPPAAFVAPADAKALEGHLDYWVALQEATGMAWDFISSVSYDKRPPEGWSGDYYDGFGGFIGMRGNAGAAVTFSINATRGHGPEPENTELAGRIPPEAVRQETGGTLSATYTHHPSEEAKDIPPAKLSFRKIAHFLIVESQDAAPYTGQVWIDGIYRWSPVPTE